MNKPAIDSLLSRSVLGYGCGSLSSFSERRQAVRLLHSALDLGITHFDVARSYGYGQTEGILGEFLKGRRHSVTVTTKYGQGVVQFGSRWRGLLPFAKRVLKQVPILQRLARRGIAATASAPRFDPVTAAQSLETSLSALGTDYVDVFLLHEALLADAQRDDVCAFLERQVERGTVLAYGVGGAYEHLNGDVSVFPRGYRVFQFEDGLGIENVNRLKGGTERTLITFGVSRRAHRIAELARQFPELASHYTPLVGEDLEDPESMQRLAFAAAVSANPTGVTLTSTLNASHLTANAEAALGTPLPREVLAAINAFAARAVEQVAG